MNPNPEQPDAPFHAEHTFNGYQVVKGGNAAYCGDVVCETPTKSEAHRNQANLICASLNAATALHAAGWDAARVFERLPEVMRVLDHNCTGFAAQLKRDTAGGGR